MGITSDDYIQWEVQSDRPLCVSPCLPLLLSSSPLDSTIDCNYDWHTNIQNFAAQVAVVSFDVDCSRWFNERIQGPTWEILATLTSYQRELNVCVYWTVKDSSAKLSRNLEPSWATTSSLIFSNFDIVCSPSTRLNSHPLPTFSVFNCVECTITNSNIISTESLFKSMNQLFNKTTTWR